MTSVDTDAAPVGRVLSPSLPPPADRAGPRPSTSRSAS